MMGEEQGRLLERLLAGEQSAFKELVDTYQGAMRAVAYAIVGSRNADEVVQDAWLAVVRNLAGFQQRSSLKTWLLTITANTAKTATNRTVGKYCSTTCLRHMAASAMSDSPAMAIGC